MEMRDTQFYRALVSAQTRNLTQLADSYRSLCCDNNNNNENVNKDNIAECLRGDMRSACDLAKLLIDERFAQFVELIDQCDLTTLTAAAASDNVKPVMCSDLQGFWDMVDLQIKDVERRFVRLDRLRRDNNFDLNTLNSDDARAPVTTTITTSKAKSSSRLTETDITFKKQQQQPATAAVSTTTTMTNKASTFFRSGGTIKIK